MYIPRIYDQLEKWLDPNRVLVLYGPRRVGKTTLVKRFLDRTKLRYRFETGENILVSDILSSRDLEKLREFVAGYELLVIDEAQLIPKVGWGLKLLVDHVESIKIIVTGSASLELANKVGEPLVGRQWTKILYPVSYFELRRLANYNNFELKQMVSERLIYGSYPEVMLAKTQRSKRQILEEITSSYLLKDILAIERVKGAKLLLDLLRLLAFQVGSEVSLTELGSQLGIDKNTVVRYLDLLEKAFVIYNLRGFSLNLRKAISKKSKYYFWDNGIMNAVMGNFNSINLRNDVGALWENFLVIERLKKQAYQPIYANNYFWRTWDRHEIDWVEMRDGKFFGYEFKWKKSRSKHRQAWLKIDSTKTRFKLVNKDNFLKFIT